jgi:hypothetical protein
MEMEPSYLPVEDLLDLFRNGMLKANAEYQRGAVWTRSQQRKLIDSVFRGYPLPMIYLHHIKKSVAGMQRDDLEIIDGQQRITALFEYAEGAYKLFDPVLDDKDAKFPAFVKRQPCPWARKDFTSLSPELQDRFLKTSLAMVRVSTDSDHEARDLFIRLQAGLPLNAQETRDAWPGHFTDYILKLGGKPALARYPGHPFFQRVLGMKPASDRGKTRMLAAQIAMLVLNRRARGADAFIDISSKSIDDFYYTHLDFDRSSEDAQRLIAVLDKLDNLLGSGKRPRLKGHDAIHLVLLTDSLWDDYTRSWEDKLPDALDQFLHGLVVGKASSDTLTPDEFWTQYGQWTRVNSDAASTIAHRHAFYVEKMFSYLAPLQPKDSVRGYGPLEREFIYFRDKKRCAVCGSVTPWDEVEIHHVVEHWRGGETTLENGVLVHSACHPKGAAAEKFAQDFRNRSGASPNSEQAS